MSHIPVLLNEVIHFLNPKQNGIYLDCTFGAGGYSKKILSSADCILYACDQDYSVIKYFDQLKLEFPEKTYFLHKNFAEVDSELKNISFDGIVLDLGVSSMQLDIAERGFSFLKDAPLDMRMNQQSNEQNAFHFINYATESNIADIIYYYGDETKAKRIAAEIVQYRKVEKIATTFALANIVRKIVGYRKNEKGKVNIDPATKTFQAIRIYVNDEINNLITALQKLIKLIKIGGTIVIVTFHSLEDRIVKKLFVNLVKKEMNKDYKLLNDEFYKNFHFTMEKNIIIPSDDEVHNNIRARSAKMRVLTRIE